MGDDQAATASRISEAAIYLGELLLRRPYRYKWEQYVDRQPRRGQPHRLAVTKRLRSHLLYCYDPSAYGDMSLGSLQHRVSRALRGEFLTADTLRLFIDAFELPQTETRRLWSLFEGSDQIRVLRGPSIMPANAAAARRRARHRTRSVHEHHFLGADGLPSHHRTQQVIQAIEDGLDRYPYLFDTNALTVEVELGGKLTGPLYKVYRGIYAVDIQLNAPLALRDTTVLVYQTLFHYSKAPKPELRRAAQQLITDVSILVQFHPDKLPQRIWWAVWSGIEGEIVEREPVSLHSGVTVSRYLDSIENTVVGFAWEW
ncbi:MAG TPA: hypothetical protein VGS19_11535 [Streptosporangiaceae bacterium]|nr:hypothetical protein [Streptosporangiaceae bacterium]